MRHQAYGRGMAATTRQVHAMRRSGLAGAWSSSGNDVTSRYAQCRIKHSVSEPEAAIMRAETVA